MKHYQIKHLLPVFSPMRRAVAIAVLVGFAVASVWERNALTNFPFVTTGNAEAPRIEKSRTQQSPLTDGGAMPELEAIGWLNSAPLQRKSLLGQILLVDFWAYTCINSL